MLGLNPNISILLYRLVLINLDKVIMKVKMIEIRQKNILGILQINAKIMQLEMKNQIF